MKKSAKRRSESTPKRTKSAGSVGAAGSSRRPARAGSGTGAAGRAERPLSAAAQAAREQTEVFEKAISLFHARNFARARDLFERAAGGAVPEIAHAARVHARMCEQRIAKEVPRLVTAEDHYNYGVALMNRREIEQAVRQLKQALSLAPQGDHVLYALALCHCWTGDLRQAAGYLKQAIETQPRNRAQAINDPDFAEFIRRSPLEELLFPERGPAA